MRKEVKKNAMIKRLVFLCILVVLSTVLWGCGDVKAFKGGVKRAY